MSTSVSTVERVVRLTVPQAQRLASLAQAKQLSEDQVVSKALDILFSLTDVLNSQAEGQGWSILSEASLARIWDNELDAAYDNWQDLYGIPTR
ncbi:MAG: hypothetical protein KIT87_26705 [Anaerolineae bacterium]|nr:hypothetical protein [Anaerolineae bacterium]